MNKLEKFEKKHQDSVMTGKQIPDFKPGDTVKVGVLIVEGDKERVQAYEGVCIARKNRGLNSSFTVRKISNGEGVERVFPLFSPRIAYIEVLRRGEVRRGKLYYMRDLTGKAARIKEKLELFGIAGDAVGTVGTADNANVSAENTVEKTAEPKKPAKAKAPKTPKAEAAAEDKPAKKKAAAKK